jgi:hypothetical protein
MSTYSFGNARTGGTLFSWEAVWYTVCMQTVKDKAQSVSITGAFAFQEHAGRGMRNGSVCCEQRAGSATYVEGQDKAVRPMIVVEP